MGEAWGYLPSASANVLMANQDTVRISSDSDAFFTDEKHRSVVGRR